MRGGFFSIILLAAVLCGLWGPPAPFASAETASGEESGTDAFTLEQSVERALAVNPRMRAARSELEKAESDIAVARGEYFPRFSAQTYMERIDSLYEKGPVEQDYIDQDIKGVTFRLSQPLFAGLAIFSRHQKSILEKERITAWKRQQEQDLALEVRLRFLELFKAREDVRSFRDSVKRLETGAEAAEAFHERRMAPYNQVLQAYVDLAEARQQLGQAENLVDTTKVRLNILLGFSAHRDISYTGALEKKEPLAGSFSEHLEYAFDHRPELAVARKGIEMAEKDKAIARGDLLPDLNATVDYNIRDVEYDEPGQQMGQEFDRDRRNEYWTAGIRLRWEFGLGGQEYYRHRKAGEEIRQLRHSLDAAKNEVTAEVRTYLMNIREAAGRIDTMEAALEHAREGYGRAENRFSVRVGTISELLDAQARLSRAEAGYNEAVADYLSGMARLYHAMGHEGLFPDKTPDAAPENKES